MKRLLIIFVFSFAGAICIYSQGEIDEQLKVFFRNERSFGLQLNTDGFGLSYRAGKRIDYLNKRLIEVDLGTLKSPKEYRLRNPLYGGGAFVFGKQNSAFYLRGGYGHQHELYSKEDFGGIAIRYFYSAGPVFAIYKPIYYRIEDRINEIIIEEPFSSAIADPSEIAGRAPFTKGLRKTKAIPGGYAKAGFNFEYSKEDRAIHAIEFGGQLSAFFKEVPIMANDKNRQFLFSLFVSYRFGMIIDPLRPETNSIFNMFRRNNR